MKSVCNKSMLEISSRTFMWSGGKYLTKILK